MGRRRKRQDNRIYLAAFLIPLFVMILTSFLCRVAPFGDNSYMIIDALHQYLPFFSEYQRKLQEGGSLFYSWNSGMGINFFSLWTYYLASPLNLVFAFGKQEQIPAIADMLLALKICLASVSFAFYRIHTPVYANDAKNRIYLRHRKKDATVLIGSLAYCFCSYMIGYSWNVMWLDSIALFPIVLYGMERLLVKKDGRWYTVALSLALSCNYYIGYMICLFLVLWFFVSSHGSFRRFLENGLRFAFCSVLAAGMSAAVLLPAWLGLRNTAAVNETPPGWTWFGNIGRMASSHMIFAEPITNQMEDGGTNLYAGMLVLYLALLYLSDRKIPAATRFKKAVLLAFFWLSFQTGVLNYVWHGFHNQYGIPNRFAFLYVFTCITMAMDVVGHIRSMSAAALLWPAGLVIAGVCGLMRYSGDAPSPLSGAAAITVTTLYLLLFITIRMGIWRRQAWRYALAFAACFELCVNAVWGFLTIGQVSISKFYNDTQIMEHIRERYHMAEGRMELAEPTVINEGTWHRLPCVTLFGSTAQGDVTTFMGRMGMYTGANEYEYRGSTPFTDSLFGVRYLFVRSGDANRSAMRYRETIGNVEIYENPYALSLGFCVDEGKEEELLDDGNPFHYQNKWAGTKLYSDLSLGAGTEKNGTRRYQIKADHRMDLFLYFWDNDIETVVVKKGGKEVLSGPYRNQCVHVGKVSGGERIRIVLIPEEGKRLSQPSQALAAEYDASRLPEFYEEAMEHPFVVEKKKDGYLSGSVELRRDRILVTTIPYDRGWSVTVDGKKQKAEPFDGTFLSVPLEKGNHRLIFTYCAPGIRGGVWVSLASWLVFCFLARKWKGNHDKL